MDWHGLKNFKDFEEFVNVSFFYPNCWTAPKAQDGYINKFISPKQENTTWLLFIHSDSAFEVLFSCLTQLRRCYRFFFSFSFFNAVCLLFFLSFFLYVASCVQQETCQIFVNVMKMWKNKWRQRKKVLCRTVRCRSVAFCYVDLWEHLWQWPDISNVLYFVLIHANDVFLYLISKMNLVHT